MEVVNFYHYFIHYYFIIFKVICHAFNYNFTFFDSIINFIFYTYLTLCLLNKIKTLKNSKYINIC